MKRFTLSLVTSLLAASAATPSAQPAFDSEFSPRERLMENFESKAPPVGAPVPAINAYDSEGTSFNLLERLKGRHAVLVFGCLT